MKKLLILIAIITAGISTNAQQVYKDVVYLKNGSIIRGKITEQVPDSSMKIETKDGSIFVFRMEEIEKQEKEPIKAPRNDKGYLGILQLGYAFGEDDYDLDYLKLNIINCYRIDPYLAIGGGYGVRYYLDQQVTFIPLFADFRVNFVNTKVSPFFAFDLGYTFYATNGFGGVGMFFSPSAGLNIKTAGNSTLSIGVGYEIQKYDGWDVSDHATSLNIGISF
jgi:hypothetical protein